VISKFSIALRHRVVQCIFVWNCILWSFTRVFKPLASWRSTNQL